MQFLGMIPGKRAVPGFWRMAVSRMHQCRSANLGFGVFMGVWSSFFDGFGAWIEENGVFGVRRSGGSRKAGAIL